MFEQESITNAVTIPTSHDRFLQRHAVEFQVTDRALKEKAIVENFEAFEAMLPLLLQKHKDEFALLSRREVIGFFDTASAAQREGVDRFPDGAFSIQKVEENAIDLGFYSYARYRRNA